jgi:hypothetical protein
MLGSGGLLTEYSFGVCRDLADYQLNIHLMYEWIRQIADQIFIGVCRDLADYQPNIHLVYAGVRRITNWIFNSQNDQIRWIGIEYLIVGMTILSGSELNIQKLD